MYTLHCTYMNRSPPVKPIATTTSLVQNGHSRIPGRKKIKKEERKRTWSILAGLHWISQKLPARKLSQSLGHANYSYFAIFLVWPFFFPLQVKHMQTSTSLIRFILTHQRKTKTIDPLCLSPHTPQSQTESRQQWGISLGPFTPLFKQKLDQIMKGILWHGFLFVAGDSTQWPKKSVPLWSNSTWSHSL